MRADARLGGCGSSGFTLLELLVALTILALAFGALMQSFGTGFRGIRASESHSVALLHARSKLEEIEATIPLAPGSSSGSYDDGYEWTAEIRAYEGEGSAENELLLVVPYEVEVTITWSGGRSISLKTMRLARRE